MEDGGTRRGREKRDEQNKFGGRGHWELVENNSRLVKDYLYNFLSPKKRQRKNTTFIMFLGILFTRNEASNRGGSTKG